jgi:hypothetical protein
LAKLQDKINDLEDTVKNKNAEIDDLTNKLSAAQICFSMNRIPQQQHFVSLNATSLHCNANNDINSEGFNLAYILYLYKLNYLYLNNYTHTNLIFSSSSLITLSIDANTSSVLITLQGIEKLPNLETLSISDSPNLKNIPSILSSYDHKIRHITIKNCVKVDSIELQTYCNKNKIVLDIS